MQTPQEIDEFYDQLLNQPLTEEMAISIETQRAQAHQDAANEAISGALSGNFRKL